LWPGGVNRQVGFNGERTYDALDDEQPAPSAQTACAFHSACDGAGEQSAKAAGKDGGGHVDAEALGLFLALVPRRDDEEDAWGEARLEDAYEDAESDKVLEVVDGSHYAGEAAPDDHDGREVDGWAGAY
jgi:hypothetical protein